MMFLSSNLPCMVLSVNERKAKMLDLVIAILQVIVVLLAFYSSTLK